MKKKTILYILALLLIGGGFITWKIFGPTVAAPEKKYFYVATGATYDAVKNGLQEAKIISSGFWFDQVAGKLNYPTKVKAGRYEIKAGMSIFNLVRMLRSGNQSPVNLVINKLRTKEDLAQKIAANFECDSLSVISFLYNADSLKKYNLDSNTVMTAVIPNTYSMLWNTSASKIFRKLYSDQEKFWNDERTKKATALHMTPQQVYTMASIVEEETNKEEDKGKIASVYINRINNGTKLEADPTVKFAMRDFGLKRILHVHLAYPSPYNTYQQTGLPPGPICTPSSKTIDAVLNAPQTNYIFFVAKPDFNGYSNFASTYTEHLVFAKAYQHALDSLIKAKAERQNL
ncbi:endolytic transglycosylase MltG [Ferruginibacter sp. SUN106]|uniref:endolytic transglycosylase MltG n=1 Tax=Ferruginibacter sp. SUN106 TaxID=2978348 RepID=UPI003D35D9AA